MPDLTDDEMTVLLIAAEGESMMPLGRWEKPVESLVERGLLWRSNKFNNFITAAGRAAIKDRDQKDNAALKTLVNTTAAIAGKQTELVQIAGELAQSLAMLAKDSSAITGDLPHDAAQKWAHVILKRALEILA